MAKRNTPPTAKCNAPEPKIAGRGTSGRPYHVWSFVLVEMLPGQRCNLHCDIRILSTRLALLLFEL